VNVFKKSCIFKAKDKTDDNMLWNDSDNMAMEGVSVWKMKVVTAKMKTLIHICRYAVCVNLY
jgi:hypothetical protein